MERTLVTGATGFIGRHLVRQFLSAGRPLTLAVRDIDACPADWRNHNRTKIVVTGPIETATNLKEIITDVSTVVHLAGLAHVRQGSAADEPFLAANAIATARLVEVAAEQKVATFVHVSSLAAITQNASLVKIDDITDDPPTSPYGRAKREAEKRIAKLSDEGIFAVSLRPPLVVGAEAKGNWGALQRLAATGLPLPFAGISNRRSLISVGSLVAAIDHLCNGGWPREASGNYCIADEELFSLPRIITELRRGMNLSPRLFHFPEAMLYLGGRTVNRQQMVSGLLGDLMVDSSRFRTTFGFKQLQDLSTSIAISGKSYQLLAGSSGDITT